MLPHFRRHVIAYVALFVALGGTSFAATKLATNSVGNKQIKAGAVTNTKLARNAVTGGKVRNGSLTRGDFKNGTLLKGAKGDMGAKGDTGPSTGPAGGDLSGTYPNPKITQLGAWTPLSVGQCRIINNQAVWTLGADGTQIPAFRIDRDGMAHLRGGMACPQAINISVATSMPAVARPLQKERFPIVETHGATANAGAFVIVQADGELVLSLPDVTANAFVSLDGIEYDTKH